MAKTSDTKLDLLARSLQEHMALTRELGLDFAERLLAMTLMEIRLVSNQISPTEIEELCLRVEQQPEAANTRPNARPMAQVVNLSERRLAAKDRL